MLAFWTRVKYGVLLSAGDEGPPLSSQEVAALAECTVLSHLRDLLNSNVSRLRQKPGLQCCLNPHSKLACWIDLDTLGRVFRTAIYWTARAVSVKSCFLVPADRILLIFICLDILEGCVLIDLNTIFSNSVLYVVQFISSVPPRIEKSFRKLWWCSNLSKVCIKKKVNGLKLKL